MYLHVTTFFFREFVKAPIAHFERHFDFTITSILEWTLDELVSVFFLVKVFELKVDLCRACFELLEIVEWVCSSRCFIVLLEVSKVLYV
jgi:Na+/H+ antiporter NhaA